MSELERRRRTERWIAILRLVAVAIAVLEVAFVPEDYPSGYEREAWLVTAGFVAAALVLFWLAHRAVAPGRLRAIGISALVLDSAFAFAYIWIYSFDRTGPAFGLVYLPVVEAAFRYGVRGGAAMSLFSLPVLLLVETWRKDRFEPPGFEPDFVFQPTAFALLAGLGVGLLVDRVRTERRVAEARADEAEALHDELGRRADVLEAVNRCARALGSSLELDEAFSAFLAELDRVVPSARLTIVLSESGTSHVMATAGVGADEVFPAGSSRPLAGTLLEELIAKGAPIYRDRLDAERFPAEVEFVRLGLLCRLAAPLLVGTHTIGMLSIRRREPGSFSPSEIELVGVLGRFVGSAVQNIRAYEAERRTVDELRRLSALRADFVSLVSHELRSPMAAVIGSARTLEQRWDELTPEQRRAFLVLIAEETSRLAMLIGDVLDTSRIEAGTFTYTFGDVAVSELVHDSAAAAAVGQDGTPVETRVDGPLPVVRGDPDRLRQVLANLLDNALKYSPAGEPVVVSARTADGHVVVDVEDRGPGIPYDQQQLIFEKFGRASVVGSQAKPGTGLGLYIARSIAEAHGGSLDVRSAPGRGTTFRLTLPLEAG